MLKRTFNNYGRFILFITVFVLTVCSAYHAYCIETTVFKGQVLDAEGNTVAGAEIFVYDSPDTRRPADFISSRTDAKGLFSMIVPAGKYWIVARLRKGEKYGPLMIGDKHSGEPVEFDLLPDEVNNMDFTVVDIREAARLMKKTGKDYMKLNGIVIDKDGNGVGMIYVFASRKKKIFDLPDYISAWTDKSGQFALYLLPGTYYIGYAKEFPAAEEYQTFKELKIKSDTVNFDIVVYPDRASDNN